MVFFHSREGCFQIWLGVAVSPFDHDLKVFFVFHQTGTAVFQSFVRFLEFWLTLPFSVNKTNSFPISNLFRIVLQLQDFKRGTASDFDHGIVGYFLTSWYPQDRISVHTRFHAEVHCRRYKGNRWCPEGPQDGGLDFPARRKYNGWRLRLFWCH